MKMNTLHQRDPKIWEALLIIKGSRQSSCKPNESMDQYKFTLLGLSQTFKTANGKSPNGNLPAKKERKEILSIVQISNTHHFCNTIISN